MSKRTRATLGNAKNGFSEVSEANKRNVERGFSEVVTANTNNDTPLPPPKEEK